MMKLEVILFLAVTLSVLDLAWAYPKGAPDTACPSMMPYHVGNNGIRYQPQNGTAPYSIYLSPDPKEETIVEGQWVQVTLKADKDYFMGFLLNVSHVNSRDYGRHASHKRFIVSNPDTKLICDDQAVTHSEHKQYWSASVHWVAPAVRELTCFQFVGTVVHNVSTYYMGVTSEQFCVQPVMNASAQNGPFAACLLILTAIITVFLSRN